MELDEKQFKDLIHRQRDLIWRVCSSYRLSAAWTTEDAFHEVLCNLWRGYEGFRKESKESTSSDDPGGPGRYCVRPIVQSTGRGEL